MPLQTRNHDLPIPAAPLLAVSLGLGAALAPACTPQRVPPTLRCTGNQHCPADGFWYCDLTTRLCARCAGACPVVTIPDADGGSLPDAATPVGDGAGLVDGAAAGVGDGGGDAADKAEVDAGPAGCDTGLPVPDGVGQEGPSCHGKCGGKGGTDPGTQQDCWCDPACKNNGDCCFDYEARCGCLAPASPSSTCDQRCGERKEGASCQCDVLCAGLGDCCGDFATTCASCAGACGKPSALGEGNNVCYCDAQCKTQSDCCYDHQTVCAADGG